MGGVWTKFRLLFSRRMEVVLVGLDHAGKTTFLSQLSLGQAVPVVPTLGLNVQYLRRGPLRLKVWDLGGTTRYRSEWARYARGTDAILFMVDSSAPQRLNQAKKELHMLLENRELEGIPLLVLSNKQDLQQTLTQAELVKGLNLDYIDSAWAVVSVSSLTGQGVERAIEWLLSQSLRLVQ